MLRALARRRLPGALWQLPKRGFTVPVGAWIAGPDASRFRDEVLNPAALIANHVDIGELERRFAAHVVGQANHEYVLWATWVLERWLERARARGHRSAHGGTLAEDAAMKPEGFLLPSSRT